MSCHQRRYREKPSHPIPVWNGLLEHLKAMGMAVWLYLWCLDKITNEEEGVGHVLGGAPVKVERIAKELDRSDRAVRRDLTKLRTRYLRLRWTPYGYVIAVLNSQKFGIWKPTDSQATNGEARGKSGEGVTENGRAVTENGRSKEDAAVAAVDTAVKQPAASSKPEDSVWNFLEIEPCGPPRFRSLLESRWTSRNGESRSVLIGQAIDAWEEADGQKPARCASLFRALSDLRRGEEQASHTATPRARITTVKDIRPKER